MAKRAISVTLEAENLTWVRGRALASGRVSVSEMLDRLIRDVRAGGGGRTAGVQSVVGTLRVSPQDPDLGAADAAVRALFASSLRRCAAPRAPRFARAGAAGSRRSRG